MMRVISQIKRIVQNRLPSVVGLALLVVISALAVTAVAIMTGAVDYVPQSTASVVGWIVSPRLVLLSTIVIFGTITALSYLLYRRYEDTLIDQWEQLSNWAQTIIAGASCGGLTAIGLGIATVIGPVPLVFVPVGSLIAWPVATVFTLRQRRESNTDGDSPSVLQSIRTKTGYAQLKHLQTRLLAGIVGLAGVSIGCVLMYVLLSWLPWFGATRTSLETVLFVAFLWLVATVLVYNRYESSISDRTELRIVAVSNLESRAGRELTIKNDGVVSVELAQAKLRDTNRDLYQFDTGVVLGPGERCSFEVPESFLLEPNETAMDLPLGYTLKQGGEHPIIYTRAGEQFVLRESTAMLDRDSARSATRSTIGLGGEPTPQE